MAANSPITRYIVLKQNDNVQISHGERPGVPDIHQALIGLHGANTPLLREDARKNTYFISTTHKKVAFGGKYTLEVTEDKPEDAQLYFEIVEAPNDEGNLSIVRMDFLVDGVRHRMPLSHDELKETQQKVREGSLKREALQKPLKRAGEPIDEFTFFQRLEFVLGESQYETPIKKAEVKIYPSLTTSWTTNVPLQTTDVHTGTPVTTRGTGGITPQDMPIARIENLSAKDKETLPENITENPAFKRGRILVTRTEKADEPKHDALLPYIVCEYNENTRQFLGATLYYPTVRTLNEDKKAEKEYIKKYPLSPEEMDGILYSPDPQIAMAELFETRIPEHMLLVNPFGEAQRVQSQFILPTNKMILARGKTVSVTTHFSFDEVKSTVLSEAEHSDILSKRRTVAFNQDDIRKLQEMAVQENTLSVSLQGLSVVEIEENSRPMVSRQLESSDYAFSIYRELRPGVTVKGQRDFYVITDIIVHNRITGEAHKLDVDSCDSIDLAIAEFMLKLIDQDRNLSENQKTELKYHVLRKAVSLLAFKESEVDRTTSISLNDIDPNKTKMLQAVNRIPKKPLLDDFELADIDALASFKELNALSKSKPTLTLINMGITLLTEQREKRMAELTNFQYDNLEQFKAGLTRFVELLEKSFDSKGYTKAAEMVGRQEKVSAENAAKARAVEIAKLLRGKIAAPHISGTAINPELFILLEQMLQSIPETDPGFRSIIFATTKKLDERHLQDLQQAVASLEGIDFSKKDACEATLRHCVALLEAVYKATRGSSQEISSIFAYLTGNPFSLYIKDDLIDPQWITNLNTITTHLKHSLPKKLAEAVINSLMKRHEYELQQAAASLEGIDFSKKEASEATLRHCVALLEAVYKAEGGSSKDIHSIFAHLTRKPFSLYIGDLINTQWVTDLRSIRTHLNNPSAKKIVDTILQQLGQKHVEDIKSIQQTMPEDLSSAEILTEACDQFRQQIFLIFNQDKIAESKLSSIMFEFLSLSKTPRINGLINIRLMEKLDELIKTSKNTEIQKAAQHFLDKLAAQYHKEREVKNSDIESAGKKRKLVLEAVATLLEKFGKNVTDNNVTSGVEHRQKNQKNEQKFAIIQQQLNAFLNAENTVELLFLQHDEVAAKEFARKIEALIRSILSLSEPDTGLSIRNYPNPAFYVQMKELCDTFRSTCYKLLSDEIQSAIETMLAQASAPKQSRFSQLSSSSNSSISRRSSVVTSFNSSKPPLSDRLDQDKEQEEKERAEKELKEREEKERAEKELKEKEEKEREEKERKEKEEKEREEKERKEREEKERAEKELKEKEEKEREEKERKEKEEKERQEKERKEQEEKEHEEKERKEREEKEREEKERKEREENERKEKELKEREEKERTEKELKEKEEKEREEKELKEREENERKEKERKEQEENERKEKERKEKEENERKEKEEKERKEKEEKEREEKERKEREEKEREEKERKEREEKEREEKKAEPLKEEKKEEPADEERDYILLDISELPESGIPAENTIYFDKTTGDFVILGTLGEYNQKSCKGQLGFIPNMLSTLSQKGLISRFLCGAFDNEFIPEPKKAIAAATKEREEKDLAEKEEKERGEKKKEEKVELIKEEKKEKAENPTSGSNSESDDEKKNPSKSGSSSGSDSEKKKSLEDDITDGKLTISKLKALAKDPNRASLLSGITLFDKAKAKSVGVDGRAESEAKALQRLADAKPITTQTIAKEVGARGHLLNNAHDNVGDDWTDDDEEGKNAVVAQAASPKSPTTAPNAAFFSSPKGSDSMHPIVLEEELSLLPNPASNAAPKDDKRETETTLKK